MKRGGSLVATLETSLYDEWGVRRKNFGLADLFGVELREPGRGADAELLPALEHATKHPMLAGLEDAPRIINGTFSVGVVAREKFPNPPLTLIPSYPDLPMEKVYPRVAQTDIPRCTCARSGRAGSSTFPGTSTGVLWEVMCVDHAKLLRNAVEWATNEEQPVTVTGPACST